MGYVNIILIISCVIIIHELGHFLCAKSLHMPVKRFSFGFGPKLFSFQRGKTSFWLSLFPVGGYVLLDIENEEEYFDISPGKRILFSLGGPLLNIFSAYLLFVLYSLVTYPLTIHTILIQPFVLLGTLFITIIRAFSSVFSHPEYVTGIIGIVSEGGKVMTAGFHNALWIAVSLSLNLAIINLLPFPVFDGGKIVLACIEKINPLVRKAYTVIAIAGWIFIICLFLFTTISDIMRIV
jgi:regulator of sigma E protease